MLLAAIALAFLCQYASVSFGVGYGTVLTPLLLIIGFAPLQVVPAVLLSQLLGGLVGGLSHHRAGNISLDFRPDERLIRERLRGLGYLPRSFDSKVIFVLSLCGVVGALVGVFLAVSIPKVALEAYIGAMVLGIGLAVLLRRGRVGGFSWRGLVIVGLLSSFNKGISGGGYVPLVAGGQILSGREARSSLGSTTFAVSLVCAVGFAGYLLMEKEIAWPLAAAASLGSLLAAPVAALTLSKADPERLKLIIGLATSTLGALTLARTFIF